MVTETQTFVWPVLSGKELGVQEIVQLPDREAMSLVNANLAMPINLALAANMLSDNALAAAGAAQITPISQGLFGTLATSPDTNHDNG
jgi:hypothetical protein